MSSVNKDGPGARKKQIPTTTSQEGELWVCDTCNITCSDKNSKVIECEYCEKKRCIKCLKLPENVYKNLGDRPDFPWFCNKCLNKAMKCLKEEKSIEEKCSQFLDIFKQEIDTKLRDMKSDIDEIKVKMSAACEQSKENSGKEDIITQVCCNMNDRLARQRNMVIFNLPECS